MKKYQACDRIRVKDGRMICPECGRKLPGEFRTGCVVQGFVLRCRNCGTSFEINFTDSGPRPDESCAQ